MPPVKTILDDGATGVIGADGAATVTLGPKRLNQLWRVTNCAVQSSSEDTPAAYVYRGAAQAPNLLAGTDVGTNDSTTLDVELYPGQFLTVQWLQGTPGASVTASVYGEITARF